MFFIIYFVDINMVVLCFFLNVSSFFESYNVSDIILEGDVENCGEECDFVELFELGNYMVIVLDLSWICLVFEGIFDFIIGILVFKIILFVGNVCDIGIILYG